MPALIATRKLHALMVTGAAVLVGSGISVSAEEPPPLRPLNVFEGRVVDHRGDPVPDAAFAIAHAEEGFLWYGGVNDMFSYGPTERFLLFFAKRNGRRSAEGKTDAEGRLRVTGLAKGKYNLVAAHEERGMVVVCGIEQPNENDPLRLVLAPPTFVTATVSGEDLDRTFLMGELEYGDKPPWSIGDDTDSRVHVAPRLIPDFDFYTANFSELSEKKKVRAGPLPAGGPWNLVFEQYVESHRYMTPVLRIPAMVEQGTTASLTVDLSEGERFDGTILGPDGKPLASVAVTATADSPPIGVPQLIGAVTDQDGKYVIKGLRTGKYKLEAKRWAIRTAPG
jgi:hypothetical protein